MPRRSCTRGVRIHSLHLVKSREITFYQGAGWRGPDCRPPAQFSRQGWELVAQMDQTSCISHPLLPEE